MIDKGKKAEYQKKLKAKEQKGDCMECKHGYYQFVNCKLVCVQCGKLANEIKSVIEDKIAERTEVKQIWPTESKRVGRPKKRR